MEILAYFFRFDSVHFLKRYQKSRRNFFLFLVLKAVLFQKAIGQILNISHKAIIRKSLSNLINVITLIEISIFQKMSSLPLDRQDLVSIFQSKEVQNLTMTSILRMHALVIVSRCSLTCRRIYEKRTHMVGHAGINVRCTIDRLTRTRRSPGPWRFVPSSNSGLVCHLHQHEYCLVFKTLSLAKI